MPGRRAVAVQAVQAMKAVTWRDRDSPSAIMWALTPPAAAGRRGRRGFSIAVPMDRLEGGDLAYSVQTRVFVAGS